jgi:hypothetical protein
MNNYDLARDRPDDDYPGLALYELLFAAGLLDVFRDAARHRDRPRMIELLTQAAAHSPEASAAAILRDPERYGF